MNPVAQALVVVQALIYLAVFPIESFMLHRPFAQRFLSTPPQNVDAVMMWAIPTGFRNLAIALGFIAGVVLVNTGSVDSGRTLVVACCCYVLLTGPTMFLADLLGHYPKRGDSIPGTLGATVPAALALIAMAF